MFVIRLFQCRKKSHWENRLTRWDNFICCHFLINEFHSQIQKSFTQKSQNLLILNTFWLTENFSESQVLAVVTSKLLLKTSRFLPVLSFFLIMRIGNLQCWHSIYIVMFTIVDFDTTFVISKLSIILFISKINIYQSVTTLRSIGKSSLRISFCGFYCYISSSLWREWLIFKILFPQCEIFLETERAKNHHFVPSQWKINFC